MTIKITIGLVNNVIHETVQHKNMLQELIGWKTANKS